MTRRLATPQNEEEFANIYKNSLAFARRGIRMTGIDIAPRFIELAGEQAAKERLPATFLVQDARELSFSEEFDGAICLCEGAFGLAGNLDNHRKVLIAGRFARKPLEPDDFEIMMVARR